MSQNIQAFGQMISSIRRANSEIIAEAELKGKREMVPLEGRDIDIYFHPAKGRRAPVLFELHGGGMVLGHAANNDRIRDYIRENSDFCVVGVNYRKAPEYPYPAAIEDICSVMRYFAQEAEKYDIDPCRFALMGFSGGATLANASILHLQGHDAPTIKCQILHYPYTDALTPPEEKQPRNENSLPLEMMHAFNEMYSRPDQRSDPKVSPLHAPMGVLSKLPPTAIFVAEDDVLATEGLQYASRLVESGVPLLHLQMVRGARHGFVEDRYALDVADVNSQSDLQAKDALDWSIRFLKATV